MQSWHHYINFVDKSGNRSYINAPKGPLAQLGERVNGIHEVSGSIPLRSTKEQNGNKKGEHTSCSPFSLSGRGDSNSRPLGPEPSALAGLSHAPILQAFGRLSESIIAIGLF